MTLEEQIDAIEEDDRSHRARILLLLSAHHEAKSDTALSLVRLAYLDYFLRYPTSLERVLQSRGHKASRLGIQPFERQSIENQYGYFHVEPWDADYRRWLAAEFAADRLTAAMEKDGDFSVQLTASGRDAARSLQDSELFKITYARALTIVRNLNLQLPTLRQTIRRSLPETITYLRSVAG